jgi:hypothetical protein
VRQPCSAAFCATVLPVNQQGGAVVRAVQSAALPRVSLALRNARARGGEAHNAHEPQSELQVCVLQCSRGAFLRPPLRAPCLRLPPTRASCL